MDYTVRQSNKVIKQLSRQALRGHFLEAVALLFILRILTSVPGLLVETFASDSLFFSTLLDIYNMLLAGPVRMSAVLYFLAQFRNVSLGLNAIPASFNHFFKSFTLNVLVTIKVALWSILFVIPGIFAAIRYSQAFYVLAEHPDYHPLQCIEVSKAMMRPNMGKYILFRLSYLPWLIIAGLPSAIYTSTIYTPPVMAVDMQQYVTQLRLSIVEVTGNPIAKLLGLFAILATVYIEMGCACFYDIAAGKLVFFTGENGDYETYTDASYVDVDYEDAEDVIYEEASDDNASEDPWNNNID